MGKNTWNCFIEPEMNASEVPLIFQQDNAPAHTAKVVKEYFALKDIKSLDWPPQSPDLNPIENLWAIIKHKLYENITFPKNRNELIERVQKIWGELSLELAENLADSPLNRYKEVVKRRGKWINY